METEIFEEKLIKMTKPEVTRLIHEDALATVITKAKEKSVISLWWLIIPLYLIATLLMKTFFIPQTTLLSNIHELTSKERYTSVLFFLVLPILFIIINLITVRKIHFLLGNPKSIAFLKVVWFNVLIIVSSMLVLIIFSL